MTKKYRVEVNYKSDGGPYQFELTLEGHMISADAVVLRDQKLVASALNIIRAWMVKNEATKIEMTEFEE